MNAKFTLAVIALVGIGVFALPSTMSLFAGQHSFYNIDATGNQIPCQKCHGDVKAELSSNGNTDPSKGPITPGPHAAFKCEYCHRIEAGSASGDNAFGRLRYNNATGAAVRYAIIPVADFEAGNFPVVINGSDVYTNSSKTLAGVTLLHGKGNISATTSDATLTIAKKGDLRILPTYNETAGPNQGLPLDTNPATAQGGLDISKATVDSTGKVNLDNAGSKSVNPGSTYHAASLVSCLECHGGEEPLGHNTRVTETINGSKPCSDCHYGGGPGVFAVPGGNRMTTLQAGGFGLTGMPDDTGAQEAHKAWVTTDDGINRFGGPNGFANNGACIGCHTHVAIDINFQKGYKLSFDANETTTGVYSVGPAHVEGQVNIAIYGNGSGATYAVGDKSYTWQSSQPMYINGAGAATVLNLNSESSDSEAALQN
jgi:hypothetical protein